MKKKLLGVILSLVIVSLISPVTINADATEQDIVEEQNEGDNPDITVIDSGTCEGSSLKWEVTVCDDVEDAYQLYIYGEEGVKDSIPDYSRNTAPWSQYSSWIYRIVLSDSVENIGNFSFYYCTKLEEVLLSNSVRTIGICAFDSCRNIKRIEFPDSVRTIGDDAFFDCTNLKNINLPDSITHIGNNAFLNCGNINCTNKENVSRSGALCVNGYIEGDFIYRDTSKEELCVYIGDEETVTIHDGVLSIGRLAFFSSKNIKTLGLPDSVVTIGDSAFRNCESLEHVVLSNSLRSIGMYAFSNCELKKVFIPKSVESISLNAFTSNDRGLTFYYEGESKPKGWDSIAHTYKVLYLCTREGFDYYENTDFSSLDHIDIPDYVTFIPEEAFMNCVNLTSVNMHDSVTIIDDRAFKGCENLKNLKMSDSITAINESAFEGCKILSGVELPSSLTLIGERAFSDCVSLGKIIIPNKVTTIGWHAFSMGRAEFDIYIPDSVVDVSEYICGGNYGAKAYCGHKEKPEGWKDTWHGAQEIQYGWSLETYLFFVNDGFDVWVDRLNYEEIIIPDNVTVIPDRAFNQYRELKKVYIPNTVVSIGKWAFYDCESLDNISIPSSVKSIDYQAFDGCTELGHRSIDIPDTVTFIGFMAFGRCGNINYTGTADASLAGAKCVNGYIDEDIVYTDETKKIVCSYIGDDSVVSIRESVTTIRGYAFSDCHNIEIVEIPDSVTAIGSSAFSGCEGIRGVYIPKNVTTMGDYAFDRSAKIIYCESDSPQSTWPSSWKYWSSDVYYGCSREIYEFYNNTDFNQVENVIIPDGFTFIPTKAFYGCERIKNVTIPNSVTEIGDYAFEDCKGLRGVYIPKSVTTIGKHVFDGSAKIIYCESESTQVTWSSSWKDVYYGCSREIYEFYNNTDFNQVEDVIIPDGVTFIPTEAFYGCERVKSVKIPDSVVQIGDYAFGCSGIKGVFVPKSVEDMGNGVFNGDGIIICCEHEEKPSTWPGYWNGPNEVMYGCTKEALNFYMDTDFSNMREIVIPEYVSFIPDNAFKDCIKLEKITIPNSVTKIGMSAFWGCLNLKDVDLSNSLNTIGDWGFYGCVRIKTLNIPASIESIGRNAFGGVVNINYEGNLYSSPWMARNINAEVKGDYVYRDSSTISGYIGDEVDVTIPENVSRVGEKAFWERDDIKTINIPSGVIEIEADAFQGCTSKVVVERDIDIIDARAFSGAPITVYCFPNTNIEEFAKTNCISFFYIEEEESSPSDDIEPGDDTESADDKGSGDDTESSDDKESGDDTKPSDDKETGDNMKPSDDKESEDEKDPANEEKTEDEMNPSIIPIGDNKGDIITEDLPNNNFVLKEIWVKGYYDTEYTGMPITFDDLRVYDGTDLLIKNVDYKVSYKNNKNIGKATIVIKGKGCYNFVKECCFVITEQRKTEDTIKKAKVLNLKGSMVYSGDKITQDYVELKLGDKILKKDIDYSVTYKANTNVGKATVIYRGIGEYSGAIQKTFKIMPLTIAGGDGLTCEYDMEVPFSKGGANPTVKVFYRGELLKRDVDYSLTYKNNKKVGSAYFEINGKGNFKGRSMRYSYNVVEQDISKLSVRIPDVLFKNKAKIYKSKPVVTDLNGKVLKAGTDYEKNIEYAYADGTTVGDKDIIPAETVIYAKIRGKGAYLKNNSDEGSGYLVGSFRIINAKSNIAKSTVRIEKQHYYDGKEKVFNNGDLTIILNGTKLNSDDFEIVEYTNNVKKGTASCVIHGVGNYGGYVTVKFGIKARNGIMTDDERTELLKEMGIK